MTIITSKDYYPLPVLRPEPPKLNASIIYMAKHRIARRIKAVRLAATEKMGK